MHSSRVRTAPESFSKRAAACSGVDSSLSRVPVPVQRLAESTAIEFG